MTMMLARLSIQKTSLLVRYGGNHFGARTNPVAVCRLLGQKQNSNRHTISVRWTPLMIARQLSSSAKTVAVATQPKKWSQRWRRLARVVKYIRMPFIMGSIFMLGYQQGVIEAFRNPRLLEDTLLSAILADVGCTSKSGVTVFSSDDKISVAGMDSKTMLQAKTLRIGENIIRNASLYVRQELAKAIQKVREQAPQDIPSAKLKELCDEDGDVTYWRNALLRIEGENPHVPWKYILVESPLANAFVTEILPQRLFITTAMFEKFIENEDELALIFGHEVSHLLLGHVSQRNMLERMLRTLEVLFLSIDPTEGLVSLAVISGLAALRRVVMASFSRDHELEADELGIKIAAMACYNTKRGVYVMKKMHDFHVSLAGEPTHYSHLLTMMDTHPPTLDRYTKLLKQSETENAGKYHERCASIHQRMLKSVWG